MAKHIHIHVGDAKLSYKGATIEPNEYHQGLFVLSYSGRIVGAGFKSVEEAKKKMDEIVSQGLHKSKYKAGQVVLVSGASSRSVFIKQPAENRRVRIKSAEFTGSGWTYEVNAIAGFVVKWKSDIVYKVHPGERYLIPEENIEGLA